MLTYGVGPLPVRQSKTVWYLATREDRMRFFVFDTEGGPEDPIPEHTIITELDRTVLPGFGDRRTAAIFAKRLGLKSWTYVRV